MDSEHRAQERKRVLKGGRILFNGHNSTVDVAVRDFSASGARLTLDPFTPIPDQFELHVRMDDMVYPARVIWRKQNELGIQFTAERRPLPHGR